MNSGVAKKLLLTLPFLMAGCSGGETDDDAAVQTRGVTDTEIVLGTYTDVSGPTAIWGVGAVNGARMRFDEVNEAGGIYGRGIRFVVEDTSYQVPRAIQAANKLINRDNILAMILSVGTPTNNAVMPQQFEQGVPRIAGLVSGDRSAYRYLPNSLTGYPTADALSAMLEAAGLVEVSYRRLSMGAVALHTGLASSRSP